MNRLRSVFLASRPKTLPAGIVAVWAGCLVVHKFSQALPESIPAVNMSLAVFTMLSCMCIQIACNLFNDALDHDRHADTAKRQGPRRITASGDMSPLAVKLCGAGFLGLAALLAIPLILAQGLPIVIIGLASMLCAYIYTGGPFPLAYHGLGELFVLIFFGLVGVMGTVYVQAGWQHSDAYLHLYIGAAMLGIQTGLLSCALIEVNNIRDRLEDAETGKRTLAVRLGDSRARGLYMAFLLAPYVVLNRVAGIIPGVGWNFCWLAAILLGGFLLLRITRIPADKRMNVMLGLTSLHLILFLLAMSV